jgi:type IV secretion system protein VirB9
MISLPKALISTQKPYGLMPLTWLLAFCLCSTSMAQEDMPQAKMGSSAPTTKDPFPVAQQQAPNPASPVPLGNTPSLATDPDVRFQSQTKLRAPNDNRIRIIDYQDNNIIRLEGCLNFQTMISFADNEKIENVGIGDTNQWQVMPNNRANLLFIKPINAQAFSNMTVVTNRRNYGFELAMAPYGLCQSGQVVYNLRFKYEQPTDLKTDQLPLPEKRNLAYTYSGDKELVPLRVFDDGQSTYFLWAKGVSVPAVYSEGPDKTESLINYANRADYIMVDGVSKLFILRRGDLSTKIHNDGYIAPSLDELSPKRRSSATVREARSQSSAGLLRQK